MPSTELRVLGLIPARGGSQGVPRKNVRLLRGKPLLHYTADAALGSHRLAHVLLTTDDDAIAAVGRACGIDVPFVRPRELAGDTSPMLPVVQHALRWLDDHGNRFDAVCLLQPTSPLRRSSDIDGCIDLLAKSDADSVMTVLPVPEKFNPHWVYAIAADGTLHLSTGEASPIARRQDLPPAFHREGSVYVSRRDTVLRGDSLYGHRTIGYVMDPGNSVNIDSESDWELADRILAAREQR